MTSLTIAARSRPYLLVDVLDDLLAALVLEVDVDVGRLAALGGEEALEEQVAARRVDRRDAEAVADGAVRGASAPLAEDVHAARDLDDRVDAEEVRRDLELTRRARAPSRSGRRTAAGMPRG